jgi:hypothetical protein
MFRAFFHQFNELHLVARAGRAVTAKTAIRICLRINLQRWRFIGMKGTVQPVVTVRLQAVMH